MIDDPIRKLEDKLRRMTDVTGLSGPAFEAIQRAAQIGAVAGISDHLRRITEIPGVSASSLEALKVATQPLSIAGLSDSMRQLITSVGAHAGTLGTLAATAEKIGLLPNPVSPSWMTEFQPTYSKHL